MHAVTQALAGAARCSAPCPLSSLLARPGLLPLAGAEADVLLRQYVQEALAAKASGGSTKLYDQCVPPPAAAAARYGANWLLYEHAVLQTPCLKLVKTYHLHSPSARRLVSEVKRLRAALRGPTPAAGTHPPAADPAGAAEQLVALLRGLGACVSLVHERRHELLLKELLDVPLWQVPQVRRHITPARM